MIGKGRKSTSSGFFQNPSDVHNKFNVASDNPKQNQQIHKYVVDKESIHVKNMYHKSLEEK